MCQSTRTDFVISDEKQIFSSFIMVRVVMDPEHILGTLGERRENKLEEIHVNIQST